MSRVQRPYLIQRCMIDNPLPKKEVRFGQAIRLDYMGSSEYEWNAVPDALDKVYKKLESYKLSKVDDIVFEDQVLRLFHPFSDEELKEYVSILKEVAEYEQNLCSKTITLKERSYFAVKKSYSKVDLWIDLDNQVIFTFHKMAGNRIKDWCESAKKHFNL